MTAPASSKLNHLLEQYNSLKAKEKEQFIQVLLEERPVPQWQIDLVRERKRKLELGEDSWVDESVVQKILE